MVTMTRTSPSFPLPLRNACIKHLESPLRLCNAVAGTAVIYSTNNSIQCIPDPPSAKGSSHTGLAVGLGVGIPLGLLILAAALFLCLRMRRKRSRKAPPVAVLPVSTKGSDGVLATDYTPHTSGNSGLTSYTNGSGALMLATSQQPMNGSSNGGAAVLAERRQSAGSAGGPKAGTAGSGPIPALTGSEMQSVARLRMHDTIQVSCRRGCDTRTSACRDLSLPGYNKPRVVMRDFPPGLAPHV